MKKQNDIVRSSPPAGRPAVHSKAHDMIFRAIFVALASFSVVGLSGCRVVGEIFKVGAWFGALLVIGLLAVSGGLVALLARSR